MKNNILKDSAILGAFIAALSIFLLEWSIRAFSRHEMEGFDKASELLPSAYISSGIMPYRDFRMGFPPGNALIGHISSFSSIEQQNIVIYSFFLILIIGAAILMHRFRSSRGRLVCAISAFMLLTVPFLDYKFIPDPLLGLLLITVIYSIRHKTGIVEKALLFLFPFLIVYWRWDRIVFFLILEALCFIPCAWWCLSRGKTKEARNLMFILISQTVGLLAGTATLMVYFVSYGGLAKGIESVYSIPLAMYAYRDLPLPHLFSFPGILFFVTWFALAVFCVYTVVEFFFRRTRADATQILTSILLLLAPCIGLPYALGRSDGAHIHPMLFFTGLSICIAMLVSKQKSAVVFVSVLVLLIAPALWYLPAFSYTPQPYFSMTKLLNRQLADCRVKTETITYRSLFVGRTLYERYFANNVALYFLNPSIPPATRQINEDPGIQSSCIYGERIADDLNHSPKPMLAFITDQPMDRYEENKTRDMKSCGKIEEYLTSHPYRIVGYCASYGVPYEIRLYQ